MSPFIMRSCYERTNVLERIYADLRKYPFVLKSGFTFIETLIVMSVTLTLLGLATMSVLGSQRSANLTEAVDIFVADLRNQQSKAMSGETKSGTVPEGYGVYVSANQYTLFSGTSYIEGDPSNTVIEFKQPISAGPIGFPDQSVIYLAGSGEILGFTQGANTVTLRETNSNQSKSIHINPYGVITEIQ